MVLVAGLMPPQIMVGPPPGYPPPPMVRVPVDRKPSCPLFYGICIWWCVWFHLVLFVIFEICYNLEQSSVHDSHGGTCSEVHWWACWCDGKQCGMPFIVILWLLPVSLESYSVLLGIRFQPLRSSLTIRSGTLLTGGTLPNTWVTVGCWWPLIIYGVKVRPYWRYNMQFRVMFQIIC